MVLAGLLLVVLAPFRPAHANDVGSEQRLAELVSVERTNAGVDGLAVAGDLVDVARRHATRMADEGKLYHNPRLGDEVQGWQAVGENVGRGSDVDAIHAAFMESETHRSNVLDTRFTQIGVGVVARGNDLWVVEVFRRPMPPPAPAPAPPPAAAPMPVVAATATAAAPLAPPSTTPPTTTTTQPPPPPVRLQPPVGDLPAGPPSAALGEVELHALPVVSVPIPEIPSATKLAASLLVAVLAAQVATLRRLRLV